MLLIVNFTEESSCFIDRAELFVADRFIAGVFGVIPSAALSYLSHLKRTTLILAVRNGDVLDPFQQTSTLNKTHL